MLLEDLDAKALEVAFLAVVRDSEVDGAFVLPQARLSAKYFVAFATRILDFLVDCIEVVAQIFGTLRRHKWAQWAGKIVFFEAVLRFLVTM